MTAVDIERVLRELISPDKGTVLIEESQFGPVIFVEPKKSTSARLTFNVSADDSEVAGTIGISTPIEVAANQSRYSSLTGLAEFTIIARTVVMVGFVEKVWWQWGRTTKSEATILLENRPVTIRNSTIWRVPFYTSSVIEVKHEPY